MRIVTLAILAVGLLLVTGSKGPAAEGETEQGKAIAEIRRLGGEVAVDETRDGKPVVRVSLRGTRISDEDLVHLKGLRQLRSLDLGNTLVSSAGLEQLKGLT